MVLAFYLCNVLPKLAGCSFCLHRLIAKICRLAFSNCPMITKLTNLHIDRCDLTSLQGRELHSLLPATSQPYAGFV